MRREACHVTTGLITSQPPLRRAKARSSSGRFPPSPPSRPPSVPSFAARLRLRLPLHILIHQLGAHRCICDKSGEPAELHSGHGHGAQIHRWSNVCRSQEGLRSQLGLRKHHCWEEKVESSSLHTLALPTLASLAFPCTKIFTVHCVQVLIIRQRLSESAIACRLLVI